MNSRLLSLIGSKCRTANDGNVAIIVAASLIPISLALGAAVDYRRLVSTKAFVQEATDTAVLASAKVYFATSLGDSSVRMASANRAAQASLDLSLRDRADQIHNLDWSQTVDANAGKLVLTVTGASPNIFGGLFNIAELPFKASAEATSAGKPVEIALILDNTSSMFTGGRFTLMRQAAKDYVNQVYALGGDRVKIGVVPWTTVVNINSEAILATDPAAVPSSAPPIAGSGRDPEPPALDRLSVLADPRNASVALTSARLLDLARPTRWRGCVRSADNEVRVSASGTVTQAISDAPPPSRFPAALLESSASPSNLSYCTAYIDVPPGPPRPPGPPSPPPPPPPVPLGSLDRYRPVFAANPPLGQISNPDSGHAWLSARYRSAALQCSNTVYSGLVSCTQSPALHANGTLNAYFNRPRDCSSARDASNRPIQSSTLPACLSDPNERDYLNAGGAICSWEIDAFPNYLSTRQTTHAWTRAMPISGPNLNCPVSILPLSGNRKQVLDKLDEMYPVPGGTQADVGLLWGLRILSPNTYWKRFWSLSDQQAPSAFNSNQTHKIAIILTDGKNEAPTQYEGYYGCTNTGRSAAGNCWRSPNLGVLNNMAADNMTLSACNVMRERYGIDVYFILVDVTDPAAMALASACAPAPGHAISTSSSGLSDVFNALVARNLHLTQ